MKLFFIPGRKWTLSIAELRSVLRNSNVGFVELSCNQKVLLFDVNLKEEDSIELFHRLGGFIKFGTVIEEPVRFINDNFKGKKVIYSVNIYLDGKSSKNAFRLRKKIGMDIKKKLRSEGLSARFVSDRAGNETALPVLKTEKVLEKGYDFNNFNHPKSGKEMWGVTLTFQDFEAFSKRDYGRPSVNKAKGMLPPKLARMMVNLSMTGPGGTIWDPFCGSGTVLQEALLLGHNVIGTDVDPKAISESSDNLSWMCDQKWISHRGYNIFRHDIKDGLPENIDFDGIVTEPYLGPVLRDEISLEKLEEIVESLEPIYKSVAHIAKSLPPKEQARRMVIVIPGFKTHGGWIDMDCPFDSMNHIRNVTLHVSDTPLQWDRPNSIIRRNIKIYEF